MASISLPPNVSMDEIEEELAYQEVLIGSCDTGADNYPERLAEYEEVKEELERRLASMRVEQIQRSEGTMNGHTPIPRYGVHRDFNGGQFASYPAAYPNSSYQSSQCDGTYSPTINPSLLSPQNNATKRAFPQSFQNESQHPSKRHTPDRSHAGTPSSSSDSFEIIEHPSFTLTQRARERQAEAEERFRKQRDAKLADEQYARSFQQNSHTPVPSSSRPNVQTTLNHNGSFHRPPPPVKMEAPSSNNSRGLVMYPDLPTQAPHHASPSQSYVKTEPSLAGPSQPQQQLVERLRSIPDVIDLTASSDEEGDDGVQVIASNRVTPSNRAQPNYNGMNRNYGPNSGYINGSVNGYGNPLAAQQHGSYMPTPQVPGQAHRQMPGAYPIGMANGSNYVYGSSAAPRNPSNAWTQQSSYVNNAMNALKHASNLGKESLNHLLGNMFNGDSSTGGYGFDGDDFNGLRNIPSAYANHHNRELYNERYDIFHNHDPAKTAEEINALLENIRPDEELPPHLRVQTPDAMTIRLHKYQELGLTWLQECEDGPKKGGILADDMGLGKTIQMLSLLVTHKSDDPRRKTTLIIAPLALMRQWQQEIEQRIRTRDRLTVYVQHGQKKKKDFRDLQHYDVVLTTYGSLAAELKKMESYRLRKKLHPETRPTSSEKCALIGEDAKWYRVILDEAQCIKNINTQTAKAACYLDATYRFCMTGTPMMNGVQEFFSLIKFLRIPPYNEWTKFRLDIHTPLKQLREHGRDTAMQKLQTLCKAIMLRRTKQSKFEGQPILILPERTTEVNNPEFSEDEKTFYEALENKTQLKFNRYLREGQVGSNYSAILVLLLRLRQACCHPHLITDFGIAAAAGLTPDDLVNLAKDLEDHVVARIKQTGGNFECPVCYDAVINPAIFLPCGHDTCRECFAKIADPANAIRDGNENANSARCPTCRSAVDPKRITDFDSFKKVHMPELLSAEELAELEVLRKELEDDDSETESEVDDSETESEDDDLDENGNLADLVNDDVEEDESASTPGDRDDKEEPLAEPSKQPLAGSSKQPLAESSTQPGNSLLKKPKSSKKAKGKEKGKAKAKGKGKRKKDKKEKGNKQVTLAEMKKLANRNAKARRAYMRRLREDWMSSAKIDKTMELLSTIMVAEEGEKVLIFSQWTSLLDLLEVPVDGAGWGYRRYDGSMNATQRNDAVDDFRDAHKDIRIMLVSLKAGNAGLNLNMASQVIILDPFWNPYIEEQAIDRSHRLGQTRPVKVHRMLIENTVEDRIIELQEKKRALISEALDEKASQNIARLGVQELAYLFGVTRNPSQRVNYVSRDGR